MKTLSFSNVPYTRIHHGVCELGVWTNTGGTRPTRTHLFHAKANLNHLNFVFLTSSLNQDLPLVAKQFLDLGDVPDNTTSGSTPAVTSSLVHGKIPETVTAMVSRRYIYLLCCGIVHEWQSV